MAAVVGQDIAQVFAGEGVGRVQIDGLPASLQSLPIPIHKGKEIPQVRMGVRIVRPGLDRFSVTLLGPAVFAGFREKIPEIVVRKEESGVTCNGVLITYYGIIPPFHAGEYVSQIVMGVGEVRLQANGFPVIWDRLGSPAQPLKDEGKLKAGIGGAGHEFRSSFQVLDCLPVPINIPERNPQREMYRTLFRLSGKHFLVKDRGAFQITHASQGIGEIRQGREELGVRGKRPSVTCRRLFRPPPFQEYVSQAVVGIGVVLLPGNCGADQFESLFFTPLM